MSERERTSPNSQGAEAIPDAPGGELSDQNREESSYPPAASGTGPAQRQDEEGGAQRRGEEAEDGGRTGGAGEGSQATGHPENAG
jgi:hypothetical protein